MKASSSSRLRGSAPNLARPILALLIGVIALTGPGCVSSKYKLAGKNTPPPLVLNLVSAEPPLESMVNTVVVYQGPGSWKRDAHWDEYVITVANRGDAPIIVDAFSLQGLAGTLVNSGAEPWALEKQSRALEQQDFGLARDVAVQLGGGIAAITAGAAAGAGTFTLLWGSAYGAGAAGAIIVGAVALPVFVGGSVYANISSRHEIEREFQRRRLALPATLVVGQVAQGSVFFPVTPGPRQLRVHYRAGTEQRDTVIGLGPLAGLHLKTRNPAETAGVASVLAAP